MKLSTPGPTRRCSMERPPTSSTRPTEGLPGALRPRSRCRAIDRCMPRRPSARTVPAFTWSTRRIPRPGPGPTSTPLAHITAYFGARLWVRLGPRQDGQRSSTSLRAISWPPTRAMISTRSGSATTSTRRPRTATGLGCGHQRRTPRSVPRFRLTVSAHSQLDIGFCQVPPGRFKTARRPSATPTSSQSRRLS